MKGVVAKNRENTVILVRGGVWGFKTAMQQGDTLQGVPDRQDMMAALQDLSSHHVMVASLFQLC